MPWARSGNTVRVMHHDPHLLRRASELQLTAFGDAIGAS
jgi:hypothetical protein